MFNAHNNSCAKSGLAQQNNKGFTPLENSRLTKINHFCGNQKNVRTNRNINSLTGFTIIELLVVIAIIGLISSVVLVSMRGSTGKAKIAKGMEFSQTILNVVGSEIVLALNLDGSATDKSGYNNNATLYGSPTYVDNTPHSVIESKPEKRALALNGTSQWVRIPKDSSLKPTNAVTVEAWVYPRQLGKSQFILGQGCMGSHRDYYIYFTSDRFRMYACNGIRCDAISSDRITAINRWYHVVGTWNTKETKIIVNAVEFSTASANSEIVYSGSSIYLGRYGCGTTTYLNGIIDEVRIYERALGSSEIQQHYAEGAQKHEIALK